MKLMFVPTTTNGSRDAAEQVNLQGREERRGERGFEKPGRGDYAIRAREILRRRDFTPQADIG